MNRNRPENAMDPAVQFDAKAANLAWEHRKGWHKDMEDMDDCAGCPACAAAVAERTKAAKVA